MTEYKNYYLVGRTTGMNDRMTQMMSYVHKARLLGLELEVHWPVTPECPGHFLDNFEPIPEVSFVSGYRPYDTGKCTSDYTDLDTVGRLAVELIFARTHIRDEVDRQKNELGDRYIAVQVRTTDHNNFNPLSYYFDRLDGTSLPIFLATDAAGVQRAFTERYGDRVKYEPIIPSGAFRQTSLSRAVCDWGVCIDATGFIGCKLSGFAKFIYRFRENNLEGRRL